MYLPLLPRNLNRVTALVRTYDGLMARLRLRRRSR
jgi:hypothetical protein